MEEILRVENIVKQFVNHRALDDVSITIPKGSIFGLLGPNGAGKTTLIRIINQITMADEGKVWFNKEPLAQKHIAKIGYLPEERGLYKKMKVGEQLYYLAQLKGLSKSEVSKRLAYWVEKFGIKTWWEKNVEDLSKGMQQKIQFISTVLHEPELIILDEPFSGFDPVNANLIKDEILLLREKGCTIIFSTHRMESVEELCDHIALINKSKKVLDGKKTDIKEAYKNNTFVVETTEELNGLSNDFDVKEQSKSGSHFRSVIRIENGTTNDLLSAILPQTTVIGLKEQIPSINDIFIETVSGHKREVPAIEVA